MISGAHLIAGAWYDGTDSFASKPHHGPSRQFTEGTAEMVDAACEAAEAAFWSYGYGPVANRVALLRAIADEIEARGAEITEIGSQESGLPEARLEGERGRTTGQLRLFADMIEAGEHLDKRHDEALPDRAPLPRPDLKLVQRPLGPVAIFGASNFPLAFSVAGGDTAAALAAGCPVVVKGHPAHPGTGELVAQAIHAAIEATGTAPGVFSLIQSSGIEVGTALVQHKLIRAVGFTGSLKAGRALFDLCAQRPEPIPFFGELGSVNPVFLMPAALANRGKDIATGWAGSLTMGCGQFCTNPGIVVAIAGDETEAFVETAAAALKATDPQPMLTEGIAKAFQVGASAMAIHADAVVKTPVTGRIGAPFLFRTNGETFLAKPELAHEVFGPLGLVVTVKDIEEMAKVAHSLDGQLTATLQIDPADTEAASCLVPVLERKAGRILTNGFPTGVEVAGAMVHGGPYPASTNFGATSVGTMSIRRFLRPVSYQNMPDDLMPEAWAEGLPKG